MKHVTREKLLDIKSIFATLKKLSGDIEWVGSPLCTEFDTLETLELKKACALIELLEKAGLKSYFVPNDSYGLYNVVVEHDNVIEYILNKNKKALKRTDAAQKNMDAEIGYRESDNCGNCAKRQNLCKEKKKRKFPDAEVRSKMVCNAYERAKQK